MSIMCAPEVDRTRGWPSREVCLLGDHSFSHIPIWLLHKMDLMHENEEDNKYAFLLGSALRNDDTEQVFVVYDNLIPPDISSARLESIKEGARFISELPEEDFNALVINARTFSLASGHSSSVNTSTIMDSNHSSGLYHARDDFQGLSVGEKTSNLHKQCDDSLKLDLLGDRDSGFPGSASPKADSNKNSFSDECEDSNEEREGCFSYMQTFSRSQLNKGGHVKIRAVSKPDYDYGEDVDSSPGGSSVESPRSEISLTQEEDNSPDVEMRELRHNGQDRLRYKSDEGSYSLVNPHQALYSRHQSVNQPRALRSSYNCCNDPDWVDDQNATSGHQQGQGSKRSRPSKDNSDKHALLDLNGNPESTAKPVQDISGNYSQMRQPITANKVVDGGSFSTLTTQEQPTDLEKKRLRKSKKQEKQKGQLSHTFSDFKGNQPIDDLLSYIEGGNNHKKRAGTSSSNLVQQHNGPVSVKGEKQKKKQEKKKELINGQEDKIRVDSVHSKSSPVVSDPSSMVMGNNTTKESQEDSRNISSTTSTSTNASLSSISLKENNIPEDHDHNSGEFYDCLNSLSEDNCSPDTKSTVSATKVDIVSESSDIELAKEYSVDSRKNVKSDKNNSMDVKANKNKMKNQDVIGENEKLDQHNSITKQIMDVECRDSEINSFSIDSSHGKTNDTVIQSTTQAFIEVKKKKKRNVPKDINIPPHAGSAQHSFNPKGSNGPLHNKWRPQRPLPTSNNSCTTTKSSSISLSDNTNNHLIKNVNGKDNVSMDRNAKDLSLAGFPALMGHTNISNTARPPERRNSCGDINELKADVIETRSYCDSDRESVKSLPAAQNRGVTYANMVTAVPQHGDSSNSPSSESGVICGSQNSSINSSHPHSSLEIVSPPPSVKGSGSNTSGVDRKATVWKGSPRERRHSIGSSPDDKPEVDKCSVSCRNRQKSGSQECLAIIMTCCQSGSKEDGESQTPCTQVGGSSDHLEKSDSKSGTVNISNFDNVRQITSGTKLVSKVLPVSLQSRQTGPIKPSATKNSSTNLSSVPSSINQNLITSSSSVEVRGNNKSTIVTTSKIPAPVKPGVEAVTASKKANTTNTKSVIFLDKRFGSKTTDLGITFGFDSSIEMPMEVASKTIDNKQSQMLTKSSVSKTLPSFTSNSSPLSSVSSSKTLSSTISHSSSSQQQQVLTVVSSTTGSNSNIPSVPSRASGPDVAHSRQQSSDTINHQQPLNIPSGCSDKVIKGSGGPANGLILSTGAVLKDSIVKPKDSTSSATSNSHRSSNSSNNKGVSHTNNNVCLSKSGNNTTCPTTIVSISSQDNSSNGVLSSDMDTSSLPARPSLQPHTSEKPSPVSHHSVPVNQPHPSEGSGRPKLSSPHPSHMPNPPTSTSANSPLVMSPGFIGTSSVVPGNLYSPHFPPPLIRQVVAMQPPPRPSIQQSGSAAVASKSVAAALNEKSEVPAASAPPLSSSSLSESAPLTSPSTSVPSKNEPAQSFDGPIKVVYGLSITPNVGCGTIFFRPPSTLDRKQKKNHSEMSTILRRKWKEVEDLQKKGGIITINDK